MFNNIKHILIGILSAVIVIAVGASVYNAFASPAAPSMDAAAAAQYGNGNGNGGSTGGSGIQLTAIPASDLSAEEAAALLFMREEEKLARDVYNQMYALWGQPVFQNIAASEQGHMDQIKLLMDRYGLADPALDPGQFTDANLQALYNQLIAQGSVSATEALNVGALVEQTDIADLQVRLAQTDNADIQLVYTNLMNASYNHLAAFTGEQGGNGNGYGGGNAQAGQAGQGQVGGGVPQANVAGAVTFHGVVTSYDGMGISFTADDGQAIYVGTGNMRYSQSIGFAPVAGDGVTVVMFYGDQGVNSAISVTMDATGMTYTFRSETGQPLWAGEKITGMGRTTRLQADNKMKTNRLRLKTKLINGPYWIDAAQMEPQRITYKVLIDLEAKPISYKSFESICGDTYKVADRYPTPGKLANDIHLDAGHFQISQMLGDNSEHFRFTSLTNYYQQTSVAEQAQQV